MPPCFQSQIVQTIHKYADILLLCLIAIIAWWASGIEGRVTVVAQEQARRTSRVEEISTIRADVTLLKIQAGGLEAINQSLKRLEDGLQRLEGRINVIYERGRTFP